MDSKLGVHGLTPEWKIENGKCKIGVYRADKLSARWADSALQAQCLLPGRRWPSEARSDVERGRNGNDKVSVSDLLMGKVLASLDLLLYI